MNLFAAMQGFPQFSIRTGIHASLSVENNTCPREHSVKEITLPSHRGEFVWIGSNTILI